MIYIKVHKIDNPKSNKLKESNKKNLRKNWFLNVIFRHLIKEKKKKAAKRRKKKKKKKEMMKMMNRS